MGQRPHRTWWATAAALLAATAVAACSPSQPGVGPAPTMPPVAPVNLALGADKLPEATTVTIIDTPSDPAERTVVDIGRDDSGNITLTETVDGTTTQTVRFDGTTFTAENSGTWQETDLDPTGQVSELADPFTYRSVAAPSFGQALSVATAVTETPLPDDTDDPLWGVPGVGYQVTTPDVPGLVDLLVVFEFDRLTAVATTWDEPEGTRTVVHRYGYAPVTLTSPNDDTDAQEQEILDMMTDAARIEATNLVAQLDEPVTAQQVVDTFNGTNLTAAGFTLDPQTLRMCTAMVPDACVTIDITAGSATVVP